MTPSLVLTHTHHDPSMASPWAPQFGFDVQPLSLPRLRTFQDKLFRVTPVLERSQERFQPATSTPDHEGVRGQGKKGSQCNAEWKKLILTVSKTY